MAQTVDTEVPGSAMPSAPMADLFATYSVMDRGRVERFLARNSHLVAILMEAPAQIRGIFGPGARLSLDVRTDPDSTPPEELVLHIGGNGPASELLAKLHRLDGAWWRTVDRRTMGLLLTDVDLSHAV